MREYTFSRARQQLASLLDLARQEGGVLIRRRDGQVFEVKPARRTGGSPLDVPGVDLELATGEMMAALAESRASGARFVRERPARKRRK
ncbi:MAG: type II toxin-antitoxin system Phd/YefM family antitoxin [Candidatus Omnitrophota bacterium]|jgi:hypothetical protein